VRRLSVASLDCGAESPVYGEEPSASADRHPGGKPPRAGGAGRWAVRPVRVMPLPTVQFDETPSSGNGAGKDNTGTTASRFPVIFDEAFSMRFGQYSLNYSLSAAAQQPERLAAFIPEDFLDNYPQFGWNSGGTSVTQSTELARIDVRSADTAAVTLSTSVNGQPMELGGPDYASDGRPVVPGRSAWLPVPPVAALSSTRRASPGQTAKSALASQSSGFSQAFTDGDQAALGRHIPPGTSSSELDGAVGCYGISSLQVPRGEATRDTAVTADLTISGQVGAGSPRLVTTYDMSVIDPQSGRWYVKDIRASTQPMGTL
jgi:hypothetical protein